MSQCRRRKCLHCHKLFRPDPRNRKRQRYCSAPACRRASKAASQRRWLNKPENRDYFRGAENVRRVQAWRQAHPDNSRRPRPQRCGALQDRSLRQPVDFHNNTDILTRSPLKDDILNTARHLLTLGEDILNQSYR